MNSYPIYICTKGRSGASNIISELNDKSMNCKLFVEPQEVDLYSENYPNLEIVNIELNDNGLVYARDYVRKYAIEKNDEWYWHLDDDVKFQVNKKGKIRDAPIEEITVLEGFIGKLVGVGQVGLEYSQFAWSATKAFRYNTYCDSFICNNVKAFKNVAYDESVLLKEDRDVTLQVLASGNKTVSISKYCFSGPKNGSNKGGLYDVYQGEKEEASSRAMVAKWGGDICKFNIKKDGRPDVKINWRHFN